MTMYRIRWEFDADARGLVDAAMKARDAQLRPGTDGAVFAVAPMSDGVLAKVSGWHRINLEWDSRQFDRCPHCSSQDIEGEMPDMQAGHASQDCYCLECDHRWTHVYTASHIENEVHPCAR